MTSEPENPAITAASTRAAGVSALRRIRKLVDEENAHDQQKAIWAKRVAVIAGTAISVALMIFLLKKF